MEQDNIGLTDFKSKEGQGAMKMVTNSFLSIVLSRDARHAHTHINAFQMIGMSSCLDLSGFFENELKHACASVNSQFGLMFLGSHSHIIPFSGIFLGSMVSRADMNEVYAEFANSIDSREAVENSHVERCPGSLLCQRICYFPVALPCGVFSASSLHRSLQLVVLNSQTLANKIHMLKVVLV
ncbi:CBL-interacting serine/threonine-protein kinase 1 [Pyrus ussuriensis x Pyrus communis]|uniref:CBL-interacting serine/threonine-protein kinase 1 n=1 Tax=Pyrus ussuriensis x Pyrus communis TaxID=2448454 RepID=A0A5N5G4L9_9ROSA|nr:CBL-interacting serine/threonine-protein kinase 1 [Pyrus ussuriensis x Pyrus communis]